MLRNHVDFGARSIFGPTMTDPYVEYHPTNMRTQSMYENVCGDTAKQHSMDLFEKRHLRKPLFKKTLFLAPKYGFHEDVPLNQFG